MGTGMMEQYKEIKEQHREAVLFFQVGGFYQVYYHDAEVAAEHLGLTRTSRPTGGGKRAPMCGFPISGGDKYAECLSEKGYRVILCRQRSEKDEAGRTVREIEKVVDPAEGAELVDLSEPWEIYLHTHTFEASEFPEAGAKRSGKAKRTKKGQEPCAENALLMELSALQLDDMTPMEALNTLQEWKKQYVTGITEAERL